jgi:hypothetical protein
MRLQTWRIPAALFLAAAPTLAQSPGLGPVFTANTYTTGGQMKPSVATGPNGSFLVTWESFGQEGNSSRGIFGQRFDALGAPVGGEFQANSYTTADQREPRVAYDSSGNFVIAWSGARLDDSQGIGLRTYDSTGAPLFAAEKPAHVATLDPEDLPRIGRNDTGFVVVWRHVAPIVGYELIGQRFDPDSDPVGLQFQVATSTTAEITEPSLSMDAAGRFVVAWTSWDDGSGTGIRARAFDSGASPITGEFDVNTYTTGFQDHPSVAMDGSGGFVVAWDNAYATDFPIQGQKYDATGAPVGGNVPLGHGIGPVIARRSDGGYGAVWVPASGNAIQLAQIEGARFDDSLTPVGSPFDVHDPNVSSAPFSRTVAANDGRHLVFAWEDFGPGADRDVFVRRGGYPDAAPFKVDERASAGASNVNGVLEPGERVTVDPAYANLSGAPYALAGTASSFTGPAGPVYTIHDASADYGMVAGASPQTARPAGSTTADCFTATGNCLEFEISGARPQQHWDATYTEDLSEGVSMTRTLHVGGSFNDVPGSSLFFRFVENLFHNGITGGCGGGGYCPTSSVTRAQMAVFLLKAKHGSTFLPPPCTGIFGDVVCPSTFANWIEQLSAEGITGGCGGGNYCPNNPVTRAQMAVFLLKAEHGSGYLPPACAGIFGDVVCPSTFANWIEQLSAESITGGCGGGNYCPDNPNTRGQMAVFLVKTFGLVLYGP